MQGISSERRQQLLVKHAVEYAMIVMDEKGVIVEWSPGAVQLLGWTAEEAIGQPAAMIFTEEDRDAGAVRAELHTAIALGSAADVRWHVRKDGATVFCDGIVNRIYDDDGVTLLGFGKILREAYASSQASPDQDGAPARAQRSFVAAVLESVEDGVVACDRQGQLTFFNDAARRIHGLKALPLSFEKWGGNYHLYRADGVTPLTIEEIPLYRALKGEQVEGARVAVIAADGRHHDVRVSGRPIRDGAGRILGAVISMHEVTIVREQDVRTTAERPQDRFVKAEEQLRLATEAAQLGIWTWNVGLDACTYENVRMHDILNIPFGQAAPSGARLMADYLHPGDAGQFRQATEDTLRHGKRFYFAGRFCRLPEREPRWIELTGVLQPGRREDAPIIIGTAADITERKRDEEALRETRLRLEATLSAGEVASWIWDIKHDRIHADRNLARLFGIVQEPGAELPLTAYTDAIHPDDRDEVSKQIRHAIDTREPYRATYRVIDAAGGERRVNARGRIEFDADGEPALLAGVMLDITRQTELQEGWRLSEERYRTLITSMDEAFGIVQVLVDEAGRPVDYRFEDVNRALEQQSGLVNAAGRTIREMVPDIEPHWIEIYGRVALTREPARFIEHSAAMGYWWDVYATPMGAPEERRIAILFTDITARKLAEENLRRVAADLSEANRRKTEFLATLAHELRNPLAPMRTGLDLMRMSAKGAPGGARVLEMMDRQMKQMVHLIDDLMDVSRINSGKIVLKKESVDVKAAIANAVETVLPAIEAAHHQLNVTVPEQAIVVDADATRLAQILGNLLTNAVKYTPHGGRIALTARLERRGEDGVVLIAVADSGIGIPVEEQAEVFEMFSQVSRNLGHAQGGLGIGLSLVRSLVEMHGGTIALCSRGAGHGTTFTVTLPLPAGGAAAGSGSTGAAQQPEPSAAPGLRVVVADDNVDAANTLSSLLQAAGHTVDTVHDGIKAVQRIAAVRPDLAILDIGMPGLNGYEVAEKLRATPGLERLVLVALTGWGGNHDRHRSGQAGFNAHLVKPAGLDEIKALIAATMPAR